MRRKEPWIGVLAATLLAGAAIPVHATSLMRAGLNDLTTANSTIVLGEVVELSSYWNADATFILTDVRVRAQQTLRGNKRAGTEFTFTILGGTVGDLTALIVGGPELKPGNQYVLFLNEEDLPSAKARLTVRDLVQGVFDVVRAGSELRAVSQANRHPLLPDTRGRVDAPGGARGLPFDELRRSIREQVERSQASQPEVPR